MKLFLPIGIVTLTAAQLASAEPPKCERWEAPGTDCQLLGRPPDCVVISRELNGMMSNLSPNADLDRAKLYEKYVTCSDPNTAKYQGGIEIPFPIPLEAADIDESLFDIDLDDGDPPPAKREATASDPQTAGCAVGGGGGALGLGLAFLLVRRRRRS